MPTVMNTMKAWQDEYLELMARWEAPVTTWTGKTAKSVAKYVPERPDWAFLSQVPTMTEFVDNQLQFRRRVVDEQAAFVRTMMKAMRPALLRLEATAPATTAPAPKTRSATTRRATTSTAQPRTSRPRTVKAA